MKKLYHDADCKYLDGILIDYNDWAMLYIDSVYTAYAILDDDVFDTLEKCIIPIRLKYMIGEVGCVVNLHHSHKFDDGVLIYQSLVTGEPFSFDSIRPMHVYSVSKAIEENIVFEIHFKSRHFALVPGNTQSKSMDNITHNDPFFYSNFQLDSEGYYKYTGSSNLYAYNVDKKEFITDDSQIDRGNHLELRKRLISKSDSGSSDDQSQPGPDDLWFLLNGTIFNLGSGYSNNLSNTPWYSVAADRDDFVCDEDPDYVQVKDPTGQWYELKYENGSHVYSGAVVELGGRYTA